MTNKPDTLPEGRLGAGASAGADQALVNQAPSGLGRSGFDPSRGEWGWQDRIASYVNATRFPQSLFIGGDGRVVGTWIMGNDYRVRSGYYGGYPAGYLRRIAALFPDRRRVLHVFSGKVDTAALAGDTVDCNADLDPTYIADAHDLSKVPLHLYDLVLADPPYSIEDADRYQTTMVKRNVVVRSLAAGMRPGSRLVWLDQVLPMYRKDDWAIEAVIGMVKSTNHRFRVITIFQRRDSDEHPEGENAKRLSGEAMPARAVGIAQPQPQSLLNQEKPK